MIRISAISDFIVLKTTKEFSLSHNLRFSNPYIFAILRRRSYKFQAKHSVKLNNLCWKYKKFTPSGCRDIGIRKFKFLANTQSIL